MKTEKQTECMQNNPIPEQNKTVLNHKEEKFKKSHDFSVEKNKILYDNFYLYRVISGLPLVDIDKQFKNLTFERDLSGKAPLGINKRMAGITLEGYVPSLPSICLLAYLLSTSPDDLLGYNSSEISKIIHDKETGKINIYGQILLLLPKCNIEELICLKNSIINYLEKNTDYPNNSDKIEKTQIEYAPELLGQKIEFPQKNLSDFPIDDCMLEFRKRLREYRDVRTQLELSEILDINITTYQNYESGKGMMSPYTLSLFCSYYNITMDKILDPDKKYFKREALYEENGKLNIYSVIVKLASLLPENALNMLYNRLENRRFEPRTLINKDNIFSEENENIFIARRERINDSKSKRKNRIRIQ